MESTALLVILSAILIVLLLAAVIFLALLTTKAQMSQLRFLMDLQDRSEKQRAAQQESFLTSAQEQSKLLQELVATTLDATSSLASESLERVLSQVATTSAQQVTALAKMVEASQFGASSSVMELVKLQQATTNLLAAKDAIAYQVVSGAQAMVTPGSSVDPYTSTEAEAQSEAERLQRMRASVDGALSQMTTFLGVNDDSEYPVAQD